MVAGVKLRVAEGGRPEAVALVMTSPWPESLLAFRYIWDTLAERFRLLALDLPGFGLSEGRSELMNPQAMGEVLLEIPSAFGLEAPHLIAPDVGTSAALFAALARPNAFSSLIVGGGIMDEQLATGSLKNLIESPTLDAFNGLDGADVIASALNRLLTDPLEPEVLEDYRASYRGDRFVASAAYVRNYPTSLPPLRTALARIDTPVNVVYGQKDPLVPPVHAQILVDALPHVRHSPLDCGHLAWEEAHEAYLETVRDWVTGGYQTV